MVFVINKLKYDTDKMTLVSEKCLYAYDTYFLYSKSKNLGKNVKLWKSAKGKWLLTYESRFRKVISEYDAEKYEEIFGELEEA